MKSVVERERETAVIAEPVQIARGLLGAAGDQEEF